MSANITVLANGLTCVTHAMRHAETTSLGLWIGTGSREEADEEHGISHFLEHLSFKGTASRSAREIAEEIEAVGGELNAATGLETTAYFARVLKGDEGVALALIADILMNSTFSADELEREREVVLQEIAGTRDSPDDLAYDLAHEAAWPGQALGRPVLGTPEKVRAFSAHDLRRFLKAHYRPGNMVLAAAGAINHEPFVRHAEALFSGLTEGTAGSNESARYRGGTRWDSKHFEQSHLILAFEGPSYRDSEFFTAQVFSGLLGGGMSSRLFQEVRERRGLCYAIYSSMLGLRDTGMFSVHAATGAAMMAELIDVVGLEIERIAAEGPSAAELARAKAQLKVGLMTSVESSSALAEQLARQLLIFGRLLSARELMVSVEGVTAERVGDLARRLSAKPPSIAVVGAGRKSQKFARMAAQRVRNIGPGSGAWPS
jgi:predicted Zn-dependent peptidase